ncbi:transketolase [Trichoderma gamsii]|uniref:F-actin-capping protein subunit alpha n=1 Tax=Trichoderma gamsii TaxID=398673 RepID=A0A2P4ZWK8_9HYPO|nr:transketolase [Trichoderma gamsii]PON28643.1 transketolase [Trichoderma gamsii]
MSRPAMKHQAVRHLKGALAYPRALRSMPLNLARCYSTHPPNAKLNLPVDYATTPLLAHTSEAAKRNKEIPSDVLHGATKKMNLFQAINDALNTALIEDDTVSVFGEDVAFGGVFRCTMKLAETHGADRVFNTPLTEQGILGFAVGMAVEGMRPVAEIQFADYVFPAFDQIVNEAAKKRYYEGTNGRSAGGMTVRMPCGTVGHGGLYHSQSPEALFTHVPGFRVIMPRSPLQAKGLLLAAIRSNDPCIFMEPKILYRAAVEEVPVAAYELPLSKAEILKEGKDVTIISYGQPLYNCMSAIKQIEQDLGVSVELIDLRTIYPWDKKTVFESVQKTGRVLVVHESMVNAGVGAEVAAAIQENPDTFNRLEAPVARVAGWSIHNPLMFEKFHVPDIAKLPLCFGAPPKAASTPNRPPLYAVMSHIETVSAFVEGAPPGELADVIADIKALTSEPNIVAELTPAFEKYNEEQFITLKLPGSSEPKASAVQSHVLEGPQADLAKSTLKSLGAYVKEHFPNASLGVYPIESDSKLAIIVVANKYSPNNFWNGRWRSLYIFDPSSGSLEGSIKVDVHYYEDGNVRLLSNKPTHASISSGTGAGIAKEIASTEKKYQEDLNKSFVSLSEGAFKGLRRQLPVTRQKIEWDRVTGYRLGQDIGGGSSKR